MFILTYAQARKDSQFRNRKTANNRKFPVLLTALLALSVLFIMTTSLSVFGGQFTIQSQLLNGRSSSSSNSSPQVATCTAEQLSAALLQLPPELCIQYEAEPYKQECSLTVATKCPNASWIEEYFTHSFEGASFVGLSVGCNKGFDAVDTMRMGSSNPIFDKSRWRDALSTFGHFGSGVCKQALTPQYPLHAKFPVRQSQMYCIEPMPTTASALHSAAAKLQLDQHGFVVTNAAISNQSGTLSFPYTDSVGVENVGLHNGDCNKNPSKCKSVPVMSLDEYVAKHVGAKGPINMLNIDVEGYDFDVLQGGTEVLQRTQYLEFENNWMGAWAKQRLRDAVDMLDGLGFTCYWAGQHQLWRITNCWLEHYSIRSWSNVACVQRTQTELLRRMEQLFLKTLASSEAASGE